MARVARKPKTQEQVLQQLVEGNVDEKITNPALLLPKAWLNFIERFKEIETLSIDQWKELHLLAHVCKRFEQYSGKKFTLSLKGAPSKSTEIFMIRKTMALLNTISPVYVKEYIDWVFDKKIIPNKVQFRSLGFFHHTDTINQFKFQQAKSAKIQKTTQLPPQYQSIVDQLDLPVTTYGDLAFAKMALEQAPESAARAPYKILFNDLVELGFELNILETLV